MASTTMSRALAGTPVATSSAPRRAIRSAPAASKTVNAAFFRPAFRQQRPQPAQRCGPRQACGPAGFAFGAGPMGFRGMVNGRPMSAEEMMREAEKLWMGSGWADAARSGTDAMRLAVDVIETDDAFTFTTDVPGVSREDVKVQAKKEERELTISGSRAAPAEVKPNAAEGGEAQQAGRRRRIERRFGSFSRTFKLPDNADLSGITARFDNGVLMVTVKKTRPTPEDVTDIPIGM